MFPFNWNYSYTFTAFFTAFLFSCVTALPVNNDNPYNQFINFLAENNCTMPDEVEPPFPPSSDQTPFGYLSDPLKECQTPDAVQDANEAKFLCHEIFDALANITCSRINTPLPEEIKKNLLSKNVCNDFKSKQNIFPSGKEYLSAKLVDDTLCKLLCSKNYESLCKTLLWAHEIQAGMKSALENRNQEIEKVKNDETAPPKTIETSKKGISSIKVTLGKATPNSDKENDNKIPDNKIDDKTGGKDNISDNSQAKDKGINDNAHTENKISQEEQSNLKNLESIGANKLDAIGQTVSEKTVTSTDNGQKGTNTRTTDASEDNKVSVALKNVSHTDTQKSANTNDIDEPVESNQNLPSKEDLNKNEVDVDQKPDSGKKAVSNNPVNPDISADSVTPETSSAKEKSKQTVSSSSLQTKGKPIATSSSTVAALTVSSESSVPQDNEIGNNELDKVNSEGEETETKVKQNELKTDDQDKDVEKPKLTEFETPLGSPDADQQPESTTLQILPDRGEDEHQEDKDQDQYRDDTENEGDYPKSEYENSFNPPPPKNKETSVKSSVAEGSNQMPSYDTFMSSRNNIGRVPDDIQMIPSFPEQEDSHFFFYFLSIVLILMAGYLIFHNKQKIIALIVEGRHERRRRSHGSGYKKLETK